MSEAKPTSRRADGYEKQLSDTDLLFLHTALQQGKIPLEELSLQLPAWKSGRFTGQQPSKSTLSNIYKRLVLEEELRDNEETTEALLESLKQSMPQLSDTEIQKIGDQHFTLQAIRNQDAKTFLNYSIARSTAEIENKKLEMREREAKLKEETLELAKQKFMVETTELFVKHVQDSEAVRLATQPGLTSRERTEELGKRIFGDLWQPLPTAT